MCTIFFKQSILYIFGTHCVILKFQKVFNVSNLPNGNLYLSSLSLFFLRSTGFGSPFPICLVLQCVNSPTLKTSLFEWFSNSLLGRFLVHMSDRLFSDFTYLTVTISSPINSRIQWYLVLTCLVLHLLVLRSNISIAPMLSIRTNIGRLIFSFKYLRCT